MRLYCSFLGARLRLARGIRSLLLPLFLHNAVRVLALPFPLLCVAISAATLTFPLTLPVLMELLAGTMLAVLSHDRLSRYCKAGAKSRNKSKTSYFHSFPSFPTFLRSSARTSLPSQAPPKSRIGCGLTRKPPLSAPKMQSACHLHVQ
jgi:hypothetical protein